MFEIVDVDGERISWTPKGFATRAEAKAWLESATLGWDGGEVHMFVRQSLDEEYVEFTYYNERHF